MSMSAADNKTKSASRTEDILTTARVLVVDDDDASREHLSALLSAQGYVVDQASDGPAALALIAEQSMDIVLLDVHMPGMDGIEVCRQLKARPAQLFLPVIFVTGVGDRQARIDGKSAGADDFLSKPVDLPELLARVRNLLQVKAFYTLRERQRELLEERLDQASARLLHAERLATLGTLAGGVGHELNNILTVLTVHLDTLFEDAAHGTVSDEETLAGLKQVATHLKLHAEQLLHIARPGPDYTEPLDLNTITTEAIHMLRLVGKTKHAQLLCSLSPLPVIVRVNRARIEQILINLVGNAADATRNIRPGPAQIHVMLELDPIGRRAICTVEDNGCGIAADQLDRVFEPYVTTKPPDKGTGLGLSVARTIVEGYGGKLILQSTVGVGSRATFDLPLAEDHTAP